MSEGIKTAIITGGATIIAAIVGLIAVLINKKSGGNDNSVKLKQKGNNNIQIGKQIHVTNEGKHNERDKQQTKGL